MEEDDDHIASDEESCVNAAVDRDTPECFDGESEQICDEEHRVQAYHSQATTPSLI